MGVDETKNLPAYQQVSDRLRDDIVDGRVLPGERLPGEADLCERFGVSRSTIREAIRLLEARRLVVTTRGTTGGTFVAEPDPDGLEADLQFGLGLLAATERVSVREIVEARELLEAPACALAALRRTDEQVAELRELVDHEDHELFHLAILDMSGNELVGALTRPLYGALRHRVRREDAPAAFWQRVAEAHLRILAAIEAGDSEAAEREMRDHLRTLTPFYEKLDRRVG